MNPTYPEWATEANKFMFGINCKEAVPWDEFKDRIADRGDMKFSVLEQQRYEECSVTPVPDNDVIVAVVPVIWTDQLITKLKVAGKEDWSIAHFGLAMSE